MAVVYMKRRDGKLDELGRTEVILNNLDPTWIQKINITYQFEIVQTLMYVNHLSDSFPLRSVLVFSLQSDYLTKLVVLTLTSSFPAFTCMMSTLNIITYL